MADFFPGTEKNDSSKLNNDIRNADKQLPDPDEKETAPAARADTEDPDRSASEKDSGAASGASPRRESVSKEKKEHSERTAEGSTAAGKNDDRMSAKTAPEGEDAEISAQTASPENGGKETSGVVETESSEKNGRKPANTTPAANAAPPADTAPAANAAPPAKTAPNANAAPSAKTAPAAKTATSANTASAGAKKADNGKTTSYRDKILRHKKRRYRRTIILVVLIMGLLMTGVILWMRRGYRRAELIRISALVADDSAAYENLGGNVVQYGSSRAVCIDQRGNTLWDVSYEMQQPITSVSGNVIAIANRSGYFVYVMNTQGLMGTIRTTLPIHSIAAAENGEVAVIMNDTNATWVRLYTADGREIAYMVRTMAENGYPVAAAVSPDGETLCLSSVSMSNAAVKTNLSFYNFGKAGQKENDHRVQREDFIDQVVPYLHYIDNTTCVCVSDKQLICCWSTLFRHSGSARLQLEENVQGVFCGDSFVGILSTNAKGESQYTLDLYNKRGKKAGSVNFTMQYTDIAIGGDKIYIHNEQECQIFTISGRCLFNGSFDKSIRALIPGAGLSDLLVVTAGEVDSVRLH